MSDYRQDSELMRLCRRPPGEAVPISEDLFKVLSTARRVSESGDGAFDVTVGPLVSLWRETMRKRELPSRQALDAAMASVGWRSLVLDAKARTATLMKPGMKLDLGGIAKGYAAEEAGKVLRAAGQPRCLVALAGDIYAGDAPPGERGWRIEIAAAWGLAWNTMVLHDEGVSTSGDREQFVEIGGVRYSHIVDPRTGIGVTNGVQATVVAASGAMADAMSTCVAVLGAAPPLVSDARERMEAIIQMPGGGVVRVGNPHVVKVPSPWCRVRDWALLPPPSIED